MRIVPHLTVAGLLTLLAATGFTQSSNEQTDVRALMRAKLVHAQAILEGLALEDYQKVKQNSEKLKLLSLESGWNVLQTRKYTELSREFRRDVENIAEAANKRNLDGATLGYVEMTTNCIRCHKYVRSSQNSD